MFIDKARLRRISGGDEAIERELLELLEQTVAQTKTALLNGAWEAPLHTLKGAAANLGGTELMRLCEQYEMRPYSPDAAQSFIAALENLRGK